MDNRWIQICFDMIYEYLPKDIYKSKQRFVKIASHATAIASEARIRLVDQAHMSKVIGLFNEIGLCYDALGNYEQAIEHIMTSRIICEEYFGEEHIISSETYKIIGIISHHLGDPDIAWKWYKKALKIRINNLGNDHIKMAEIYNNIALVFSDTRSQKYDLTLALEWFDKALAIFKKNLGEEHREVSTIYRNMACIYNSMGDYAVAMRLHNEALKSRLRELGEEHAYVAQSYNDIGDVYKNQHNYDHSLDYYKKAMIIREKRFGVVHPRTIESYRNVAYIYRVILETEKAEKYYNKAEEAYRLYKTQFFIT